MDGMAGASAGASANGHNECRTVPQYAFDGVARVDELLSDRWLERRDVSNS